MSSHSRTAKSGVAASAGVAPPLGFALATLGPLRLLLQPPAGAGGPSAACPFRGRRRSVGGRRSAVSLGAPFLLPRMPGHVGRARDHDARACLPTAARRTWTVAVGGSVVARRSRPSLAARCGRPVPAPSAAGPRRALPGRRIGRACTSSSAGRPTPGRWPSSPSSSRSSRSAACGPPWPGSSRVGASCWRQAFPPAKVVFNLAMALLEARVAVAVLQLLPDGAHHRAAGLAQPDPRRPRGQPRGRAADRRRDHRHGQGYPGPQLWREQLLPIAVVVPGRRSRRRRSRCCSSALTAWAWLLIAPAARRSWACCSAASARSPARARASSGSTTSPAGSSRSPPDEAGTRQIVAGGARAAQRRAGGAVAAALPRRGAAAGRRRRERRGLVRRPGRPRRRLPPARGRPRADGPVLVSAGARRRGGGGRPRPPRGRRPARRAGHDRRRRARLPRGLRPAQRHRLLRRQRPRRAGLDAHPRQRGHPPAAAAHPDPLRRRPRPAHRPAQPAAAGRRDRRAAGAPTRSAPGPA